MMMLLKRCKGNFQQTDDSSLFKPPVNVSCIMEKFIFTTKSRVLHTPV